MNMEMIYCLLALLGTIFFLHKILHFSKPNKNLPPSPPSLPILGHLHLLKPPFHRTLHALSLRYGPIFSLRLGRQPALVISSPWAVEECLNRNDVIFANRPNFLVGQHLGFNYSSIIWASYGDQWRNLRRVTTLLAFSGKQIQEAGPTRKEEIKFMIKELYSLRSSENQTRKVNLSGIFERLTKNLVMRVVNGKRWESLYFPQLPPLLTVCDFVPVLKWIGYKGIEKELIKSKNELDKFVQDIFNECKAKHQTIGDHEQQKKTMLEKLLDMQEDDPNYYTDDILKGIIAVMVLAASHTSTRTMEWSLSLLLNHPEIFKKARSEIESKVGNGRLVDDSDLPNLVYIRCIIDETLRLFPPAPLLVPHLSSQDCTISGYYVKKGTILFVNVWALQRDATLWEEPTTFKPERFENEKEGFKFMPFGIGRRSCPSINFARRNITLALATLIQCFDIKTVEPGLVNMSEFGVGSVMLNEKPLETMCYPRSSMVGVLSQL